jgi:hypothetical protein
MYTGQESPRVSAWHSHYKSKFPYILIAVIPYIILLHDNPHERKIRTYTALIHSETTQITQDFPDPIHIGLSKWWLNPRLPLPL